MLWALVGWLGNACFFSRFLVQWWSSERAGRSLAPRVFWRLSLAGSGCLLLYTAALGEPVLLCGHAINLAIYARNLTLSRGGVARARLAAPAVVAAGLLAGLVLLALGAVEPRDDFGAAPIWIACSVVGQGIWSARFVLQWVASERRGESHFPEAFWWLSLAGSTLLIAYSLHLADAVLVAGFALGPIVQVRNLMLERRHSAGVESPGGADDPVAPSRRPGDSST